MGRTLKCGVRSVECGKNLLLIQENLCQQESMMLLIDEMKLEAVELTSKRITKEVNNLAI